LLAYLGQLVGQMVGHPLGSVCPPEESADAGTDWWPMTPLAPDVDDDLILGPGEVAMPTVLDPSPHPVEEVPIARRRTPPKIGWLPILSGAAVATIGTIWYCWAVASALASKPADLIDSTIQADAAPAILVVSQSV
jgi:hypothetical protein